MTVIVVPSPLREQLMVLKEGAELRDEKGELLGRFVPPAYEVPELDLTEEEIASLLAPERKTYTTAEVLEYLKGLTA
ncbi:MAG TPA: hypothetical protein VKD72_33415 [Gemmataceae bacterium]|nr:hypothetical protein [Gemmataceae bacterium]